MDGVKIQEAYDNKQNLPMLRKCTSDCKRYYNYGFSHYRYLPPCTCMDINVYIPVAIVHDSLDVGDHFINITTNSSQNISRKNLERPFTIKTLYHSHVAHACTFIHVHVHVHTHVHADAAQIT